MEALPARLLSGFEWAMLALAVAVAAFLILPTLIIVPMSFGTDGYLNFPPRGFTFRWYGEFLNDGDWLRATWFSVKVGVLTTIVSVVLGTAAALALTRSRVPLGGVMQLVIIMPMILPQIVVAIALLLFYQQLGMVGAIAAFVASHACLAIPFVLFTVSAILKRYDVDLDAAAYVCGAGRFTIFRRITLPIIWPGIASGALFSFLISFDEAVISFFLSGVSDKAIARKFFEDVELNVTPVLAAVATLLTLTTIIVLAATALIRSGRD